MWQGNLLFTNHKQKQQSVAGSHLLSSSSLSYKSKIASAPPGAEVDNIQRLFPTPAIQW